MQPGFSLADNKKSRSFVVVLEPWTEDDRDVLRAKGKEVAQLLALRWDSGCVPSREGRLEGFFVLNLRDPQRVSYFRKWPGEWVPAPGPKSNEERRVLFSQYMEGDDGTEQGQGRSNAGMHASHHHEPHRKHMHLIVRPQSACRFFHRRSHAVARAAAASG